MRENTPLRLAVIFGVGILAAAGLMLLLLFLDSGPGEPSPTDSPAQVPTDPADQSIVATVNDRPISQDAWQEAALIDQVMSGLAGRPAPAPEETLQRMINEELVLKAFPPEPPPTEEQIAARISLLEQNWNVGDGAVTTALQNAGLSYAMLEQAIGRLLAVELGLEALQGQGHDPADWMKEQRAQAEITILQDVTALALPTVQPPVPTSPIPTPTEPPSPIPATETPVPSSPTATSPPPTVAVPEEAPDFTLRQSGGGQFTLSGQLAQGPVVMVFFQRGGG